MEKRIMFPTFIDLAVAMNQLDIERDAAKRERLAEFHAGGSGEGFGNKLGRLFGGAKSLFGQSNALGGGCQDQTSSKSIA
jgi:hypothetical protein